MRDGDTDAILIPFSPGAIGLIILGIVCIVLAYYPLHQSALAATPEWLYEFVAPYLEPFNETPWWGFFIGGLLFICAGSFFVIREIIEHRRTGTYSEVL